MTVEIFRSRRHGSRTFSRFFEIVFPLFETAILLDQLKTTLIEPADETLEGLNVFLRWVERRHL